MSLEKMQEYFKNINVDVYMHKDGFLSLIDNEFNPPKELSSIWTIKLEESSRSLEDEERAHYCSGAPRGMFSQ